MINEDQLEQLALQWFQDTGWAYANGADLAPEGATPERADFRAVLWNARLAGAARRLTTNQSRILAALRDTLLPMLLSGELIVTLASI